MKKQDLVNSVSRTFHKVGFTIKKHSPAILVTAGVVGVVASTVMACKATTKINTILEEKNKQVEKIHAASEKIELKESGKYTEEDAKKDLTIVYTQTGVKLVKLYAPSVIVGTVSIVSILASHRILTKRNAALSAAYAVVDQGFKDYRKRVKERFGDRVDYELRHNIKAEEIETIDLDENGNEVKGTKTIDVVNSEKDQYSDFARFFDELSPYYQKSSELNLFFLKQQEQYANDRLKRRGYLTLNEVYEALGIPLTEAGMVHGWLYDEDNPYGDNFVDFGIYDVNKRNAKEFVNGYEKAILLDFNCDGNIYMLKHERKGL